MALFPVGEVVSEPPSERTNEPVATLLGFAPG